MNGRPLTRPPAPAPAIAALFERRPQVIKPGLERIKAAWQLLGLGRGTGAPVVIVGGTNGKGSTAGLLWQLAVAAGHRAGLYSSPHLVRFEERIQTSHALITSELIEAELERLRHELPAEVFGPLSFFELATLVAVRLFRTAGTTLDILEVGLGGRWDATNIADPVLSVITGIGLDHMEFLGGTTAAIAREKAGIMRPERPVLWGGMPAADRAADLEIRAAAAAQKAPLAAIEHEIRPGPGGIRLVMPDTPEVTLPWPAAAATWPPFLRQNFALALAAFWTLLSGRQDGHGMLAPAPLAPAAAERVARGAISTLDSGRVPRPPTLYGRFQTEEVTDAAGNRRPILLDVAHNPQGAQALVRALAACPPSSPGSWPGLVSILDDKDINGVLDLLRPALRPLRLYATQGARRLRRESLAERHRDLPFDDDFAAAWAAAAAWPADRPLVLCGSVHATGEVCAALGIDPLADLERFQRQSAPVPAPGLTV